MLELLSRSLPLPLVLALSAVATAGVVVDDFSGDGPLDLAVSAPGGALRLLVLGAGGEVEDATARHGLDDVRDAGDLRAVDADGDGRLDLLVLPAAGSGAELRLLVRDGSDRFRDATERAGLGGLPAVTAAAFSDPDVDGHLDLILGFAAGDGPTVRIWKGAGDGTFREITESTGVAADAPCAGIAVGDLDGDDLPDLYLALLGAPNALWRNAGGGTFAPSEHSAALAEPAASGAPRILDYDNDRDWDLFVAGSDGSAPRLYQNEREHGWKDVTAERGLAERADLLRVAFADLDHDGYQDLIAETADAVIALRNERGRRFGPMPEDAALPALAPGEAFAAADLDHDGDADVLASAERVTDGSIFGPGAYRNPGDDHLWVSVGVEPKGSNRYGVGCIVRVLAEDARGRRRDYFRRVGESAAEGGSLRQDFGLGIAERILRLEVYFPATREWQSYFQPKHSCTLIVKEGAAAPVTEFRGLPTAGRRR